MVASNKKPVNRSFVSVNSIDNSVYNLEGALEKASKAVVVRSTESKKLRNESHRLRKRRLTQTSKQKRAIAADKKNSTGDTRKAIRAICLS